MNKLSMVVAGVLAMVGCKKAEETPAQATKPTEAPPTQVAPAPTPAPTPAPAPAPTPTTDETPFTVAGTKTFTAAEGCTSEIVGWNVMVGRDPSKPCEFDTEDGFAVSFDFPVADKGPSKLPAPAPGLTFEDKVYVEDAATPGIGEYIPAKFEVLRHEKPYVIVRITPTGATGKLSKVGGVIRVKLEDGKALEDSWK